MDTRTVLGYSFIICIALTIGVKSSSLEKNTFASFIPTVATDLTTKFPIIESSGSKVDKSYEKLSNDSEDDVSTEDDVEGSPPDHIIPHTDHENPKEPLTRLKYINPGGWSTSSPNVHLDFVPTKLYAQVRNTHTVKHLPREEALKSATNEEEILAAPRLRQVVSKSKTNTIYTEEGYEDAAYDHGGHVRDADFHDGYARKLENQQHNKQNGPSKKSEVDEKEEISGAEEFNDYDDDYRDHDSSIIEESKIQNGKDPEEMEKYQSPWQDSSIDPKQVTENEIERLEVDLENEYEESAKKTETSLSENLKNSREDDEEEGIESSREADAAGNRHYETKVNEEKDEFGEGSSGMNKIRDVSSPSSKEIEDISTSVNSSADIGKIFWNYFKSVGNNQQSQEFSAPKEIIETTLNKDEISIGGVPTSVPKFATVLTTLADFDSNFDPPRMELNDFLVTSRMDNNYPSAASLYESWKRQDHYKNPAESPDTNYESSDSYVEKFQETEDPEDSEKISSFNMENFDDSETLIVPKKLSYTVLIRPSEKPTTESTPCDREDYTERSGERIPVVKSTYTKMSNHSRDQVSPEAINHVSFPNDFTVIRPPLPVPLRQVTYADFLPDSYASLARPSVTREIETIGEEINNGERDRYELLKNSHPNRGQHPHPRYNRFRGNKKNPHLLPITKLVPPSPINRSKYSEYLGVKRVGKPIKRLDSSLNRWPELIRFYRSIDRTIFGRRRRSLDEEKINEKNIVTSDSGKKSDDSVDSSRAKKLRLKRKFFREPNRLVGADNTSPEKSIGNQTRKRRNSEKLLHQAPKIVDKVIDGEIESRFKDEDAEENEEKREKIEIEVPDFNFSDAIENNKGQKVIAKAPIEETFLDKEKYPFYENSKVSRSSPLKYITNPRKVPRKTLGGTEFYDSRDRYRECDEVKPNLESVLPEEEQPSENQEPRGDQPRLRGLGDRLDCFRAKYFDDNPLDNPLFLEEQVGQPRIPEELDPAKFTSKFFSESGDNEEEPQVVRRISRKPEHTGSEVSRSESEKKQFTHNEGENYRTDLEDMRTEKLQKNQGEQIPEGRRRIRRRRRRKLLQMTTMKAPRLPVTPYQSEVYEDVMGTIKNLAGLYQTYGEPISSSSLRPNVNHALVTPREKNIASQTVHITERPRGFMFRGLPPPQQIDSTKLHRYRIIPYRTNKVSYRMRTRTESPPLSEKGVGYFRTVTVHKRSINDEKISLDLNKAEARNIGILPSNNATHDVTYLERSKTIKVDEKPAAPKRIVYTIRDRIRHSKPKGIFGKYGKFTNLEVSATEDVRRQEPRYNRIRRKKVSSADYEPTTTARWEESEDNPEEPINSAKNLSSKDTISGRHNYHDEPDELYKIQYSTTRGRQIDPSNLERRDVDKSSEDYEGEKELDEGVAKKEKRTNNYDVHENLEDDVTTISSVVEPTRAPTFFKLHEYLESDPPGYSEAFDEKSTESSSRSLEDEEPEKSYKITETRREPEDDAGGEENEDAERQVKVEESSPKFEEDDDSRGQLETYKSLEDGDENKRAEGREEEEEEEEEDEEEEEIHSPQVDDEATSHVENGEKEFERFASRPFSPFQSYDDPKYKDLGPRLSKPSFHHPSFSNVNYRRRESENSDSNESDEKKSRYVFPWHADKADDEEDVEESNEKGHKIGRYEYPWERRERLSRERRRKAKEREKYRRLYGFFGDTEDEEDDEEENASHTRLHERQVYPWEYYKVPSRNSHRAKASRWITDNEEMSSDYQPLYSSRYKTTSFHRNDDDDDPIAISGADPREMTISVTKSIEKAPKDNPNKSSEFLKIRSSAATSDAIVKSNIAPPMFTVTSKEPRERNTRMHIASTTPSTISWTESNRKMRKWRTAVPSTTKKPISRKRKNGLVNEESVESRSRKKELVIHPAQRINLNSSVIGSSGSSLGIARKTRQRGPTINHSTISTTTTTGRPIRRRIQKTTPIPEEEKISPEESTVKSITEKSTTPKVKTIEHHSRFSKEEIITKTSYPGFHNDNYNNTEQINKRGGNAEPSDLKERLPNESIKKVLIMTKETPDHIYRTEEINKNGVKGMFVSITPNNGTKSSLGTIQDLEDRMIDPKETTKMLKTFQDLVENDDEEEEEEEEDPEVSFMRDSDLLANLLKQVPPYVNHLTLDESVREKDDFSVQEGSGSVEDDEDGTGIGIQTNYVKHPNHRLYYYVEDS